MELADLQKRESAPSFCTKFAESPLLRVEWAVYGDLQEVDHEKPYNIVKPNEADEAPGNGSDEPAESRHARGQNLRAHYGGKEFPLGERRLEKETARAGREQEHVAGDDQLHEHRRLQRREF